MCLAPHLGHNLRILGRLGWIIRRIPRIVMGMHGGHLIREARRRAGLTQAELAERIATAQPNVARWESADMSPSVDMLTRIIQECGLDLLVRLVPREAGEWTRVEEGQPSGLEQRIEKLVGFVDVIEDGAEVKGRAAQKKTVKNS